MFKVIVGKLDCTCSHGSNHLFCLTPDGIVLPTESDIFDAWELPTNSRLVTVPAEIVEYLQNGGTTY